MGKVTIEYKIRIIGLWIPIKEKFFNLLDR